MQKKIYATVLSVLMLMTVTACGAKKDLVKLADYSNITVEVYPAEEVTDEEVEMYLEYQYESDAMNTIFEDAAKEGDTVIIDYLGTLDGVAFDGGTAEDASLTLGSHTFIDGFEDGLIGIKVGEERDLTLTFPKDYMAEELKGKETVFHVTCKNVIPKMSDASIAKLNLEGIKTVEQYKDNLRSTMEKYYRSLYETELTEACLNYLVENSEYGEISEEVIMEQRNQLLETVESVASQYGMSVDDYMQACGTTLEDAAIESAKSVLAFNALVEKEGFSVSDEELDARINEIIETYSNVSTVEDVEAIKPREDIREEMLYQKGYDFLIANATVTKPTDTIE